MYKLDNKGKTRLLFEMKEEYTRMDNARQEREVTVQKPGECPYIQPWDRLIKRASRALEGSNRSEVLQRANYLINQQEELQEEQEQHQEEQEQLAFKTDNLEDCQDLQNFKGQEDTQNFQTQKLQNLQHNFHSGSKILKHKHISLEAINLHKLKRNQNFNHMANDSDTEIFKVPSTVETESGADGPRLRHIWREYRGVGGS